MIITHCNACYVIIIIIRWRNPGILEIAENYVNYLERFQEVIAYLDTTLIRFLSGLKEMNLDFCAFF